MLLDHSRCGDMAWGIYPPLYSEEITLKFHFAFSVCVHVANMSQIVTSEMSPDVCLFLDQACSIWNFLHWICSVGDIKDTGERNKVKMCVVSSYATC